MKHAFKKVPGLSKAVKLSMQKEWDEEKAELISKKKKFRTKFNLARFELNNINNAIRIHNERRPV